MVRNRFQIRMVVGLLLAAAPLGLAGPVIIGALEDGQGSSGIEKNGDFNDMIFELSGGNVAMLAPGAVFSNLTSASVDETGTVFWDNPSGDGPDLGIGYCLLDEAKCSLAGAPLSNIQYLATPSGGSADNVTFDATGTVTLQLLGGITGNVNTLGWYDLDDPTVLHQLLVVPTYAAGVSGETVTFTPDGAFALYSSDGWGQVYSSVSGSNVDESADQQHFAFFIDPPATVPEPSTAALIGLGVGFLGLGSLRRKRAVS